MARYYTKFGIVITFTVVSYIITRQLTPGLIESEEITRRLQRQQVQGAIIIHEPSEVFRITQFNPQPRDTETATTTTKPGKKAFGNKTTNGTKKIKNVPKKQESKKATKATKAVKAPKRESTNIFCDRPQIAENFYLNRKDRMKMGNKKDDTQYKLPKAIIIGAERSGTEALLHFLSSHPNIKVPKKSASDFFLDDSQYQLGLRGYYHIMPSISGDEITIDRASTYFANSNVINRVYCFNSTLKLIVILRDPVQRLISDLIKHETQDGKDNVVAKVEERLEQAVFKIGTLEVNKEYEPVGKSLYLSHLQLWLKAFPLEQFLFIDGEAFIKDPQPALKQVEDFLGVSNHFVRKQFVLQKGKAYYCLDKPPRRTNRCLDNNQERNQNITKVDQKWLTGLKEYFQPHNDELFEVIGKSLSWK